jgi:hypothetical protein
MKAAMTAGSGMVELGRRLCNCVVRSGVTPSLWVWEVVCPIEKVPGCVGLDKMRPIKLLEVLKKAVAGVLKERHMRGLERMGVMRGAQYAYQRRMSTGVPLAVMNMCTEWAVMHRREVWDQGHDLAHAFDMPEYVMGKEVALRRTGVGERYIDLVHAMEEGAQMSIMTAWGLSDQVAGAAGVGGCEAGWPQGGDESPLGWICTFDIMLSCLEDGAVDPFMMEAGDESVGVYGAAYGDDLRLLSSSRRGAERALELAAAVHGFLGLPMRTSKCWVDRLKWEEEGEMRLIEEEVEGLRYEGVEEAASGVMEVGCGVNERKYLGELGNLVLDESREVCEQMCEVRRSCEVLRRARTAVEGKVEVVNMVLAPRTLYRLRCRYVSRDDVERLQQPVLAMLREGLRVCGSFSRDLMVGSRRHRMVGIECWWGRVMQEKLGMLVSMLMSPGWCDAGRVMRVWVFL